jgi:hypothetical protein
MGHVDLARARPPMQPIRAFGARDLSGDLHLMVAGVWLGRLPTRRGR